MVPPLEIRLDETTYYSTLGLSTNASQKEIHKSYVKLARELHPDKSKSDVAAELFKLISHAHSVLMDNEKKDTYDRTLISRGLLNHSPESKYHRFEGPLEPETPNKNSFTPKPQRPYEKQPYGFNTDSTASPRVKVPIFQSFNLKSYQRKSHHNRDQENTTIPHRGNGVFDSRPTTPINSDQWNRAKRTDKQNDKEEEGEEDEKIEKEEEENRDNPRVKVPKVNPFENPQNSPFANHDHRHYARTKHEAKAQGRRSTSPIKTVPTSTSRSESWNSLKTLLEKFRQQESKFEMPPSSQSLQREEEKEEEDRKRDDKIRKAESQSIHLEDLGQSLPRDNNFFDMSNVNDSIPAVKRTKLDLRVPEEPSKHEIKKDTQNIAESLFVPVNKPLPKIYKPDHILLDQYMIDSGSLLGELPSMPNFQCNILNRSEVEYCKELVKNFNEESNTLKEQLLKTLGNRLDADKTLNERLVKVENTANWVAAKDFDFEVVNKLGELQNRQRIVAQSFANLLKSAYASGQQNT